MSDINTDNRSDMPQDIQHHYYAQTTKEPDGAEMVTGWFNVTDQTDPATYPAPDTLVPITAEEFERQFSQRVRGDWQILDGKIAPYTQKRPALPLKDQAQNALGGVQKQAAMVTAMGETFGPQTRDYVKALRAIIDGSDTTSTALPNAPSDPTM